MEDEHSFDAGDWHCVAVRRDLPWGNGLTVHVSDHRGQSVCVVRFACHPELPAYEELQAMSTSQLIDLAARRLQTDDCRASLLKAREHGLELIFGFEATPA